MTDAASGNAPGMKLYTMVWIGLILIVGAEIGLTYAGLPAGDLLAALLLLALLEASLGVLYFMHLKWERRVLLWSMVSYLALAVFMLNHLWRDAARMISLHP